MTKSSVQMWKNGTDDAKNEKHIDDIYAHLAMIMGIM